jgi:hypothetical protein
MIARRSGVRKHEVDLRTLRGACLAPAPLRLAATVFVSARPAGRGGPLVTIEQRALRARLRREQPYATGLPSWQSFAQRLTGLPAYELRRSPHPAAAMEALRGLARPGSG